MKHLIILAPALAGLTFLGACTPGQVNQGIASAQAVCGTVPADAAAAQSALQGGAATTAAKIASDATQACNGVQQAAANESAIDGAVSYLDGLWESVFGSNTPATTSASTAATTPAAPATPAPAPTPAAPAAPAAS